MQPARNRPRGNLRWLRAAVLVLFAVLAGQLFRMQIVDGADYSRRARENHITQQTTLAARGPIFDRNGLPLVQNVPVYFATVIPDILPSEESERREIFLRLEAITGTPALEMEQRVQQALDDGRGFIEIAVARYLTTEQALRLEEASPSLPGVQLDVRPGRYYPAGVEFSHILGYIGDQTAEEYAVLQEQGYALDEPVGKAGIEATYESVLRGDRGIVQAEQDAAGNLLRSLDSRDPVPGEGVRLAIDASLQSYIYELLQTHLRGDAENPDATVAAAVVMEAKTGKVLAIVSYPSFDNNLFAQADERADEYQALLDDPRKPLLNQALTPSAPGSTFKIVTAAAGLQNGTITPDTSRTINEPYIEIIGENGIVYPFYDWTTHGNINLYGAIARSSNIYFYMASCGIPKEYRGLGSDDETSGVILGYYARQFGYGQYSGIDIGGEAPGVVPSPEWKRRVHAEDNPEDRAWYYADTCFMGIGQGDVLATPMQVARMTAAVANGGNLVTPLVADAVLDTDGNVVREIEPHSVPIDVDEHWLAVIREGMRQSVDSGAGMLAYQPGIDIAGKTGTAEFVDKDLTTRQHAWFTGFAPFGDPKYVVTVYFDYGVGGNKAAPVAGQIFRYLSQEGMLP
jgi:penicillin-binding protein 2